MDAVYFRQRAERAREMARSGNDPRLAHMLLEVALDMDAEADLIDAAAKQAAKAAFPVALSA